MWSLFRNLFGTNKPELELDDYNCSAIEWLTRPLKNSIAATAGGKHSMVNIRFTHHQNRDDKIEFCVERLTNGIYHSDFIKRSQLIPMCGNIYHAVRYKYNLKKINLTQFLIECNLQNEIKYSVGNGDCHCFAKYIWDLCTKKKSIPKPNPYLVAVAKAANYKLDHKTKNAVIQNLRQIDELDPRINQNVTILKILAPQK